MSKDNSAKSKEIIKLILSNGIGEYKGISLEQKKVIINSIPEAIKCLDNSSLIKNNQIIGRDKKTYKINYNEKSKWIALPGFQKMISTVLMENNFRYDCTISPKANFLLFISEFGLSNYLKYMFDSITDVDQMLIFDKEIKNMYSFVMENFNFENAKFTSDITKKPLQQTWYVTLNGDNIFQIQAPASAKRPNSHILRVNAEVLSDFYKKIEITNETWGISVEVALCQLFSIVVPNEYKNRFDPTMVLDAQSSLGNAVSTGVMPAFTECLATKRIGMKKSSTDFLAGKQTISVKTNFNNSKMVCPPEIGQPGIEVGLSYYNSVFGSGLSAEKLFSKKMIEFKTLFQKNIASIVSKQVEMLFSEDSVLYVRKKSKTIDVLFVDTKDKHFSFDNEKFKFSRTPEEWNESVSISYDGIQLAEMQLHTNRSPFKFRFNFENLLKILSKNKK